LVADCRTEIEVPTRLAMRPFMIVTAARRICVERVGADHQQQQVRGAA